MKDELKKMERLCDRVWNEIEKTDLNAATVKNIGEAVDIIKDLYEAKKNCLIAHAMMHGEAEDEEDGEYGYISYPYMKRSYYGPEWGNGMSGSYGRSRMNMSRRSNGTYRGYDQENAIKYLENKMANASTDEERNIIRGCIENLS